MAAASRLPGERGTIWVTNRTLNNVPPWRPSAPSVGARRPHCWALILPAAVRTGSAYAAGTAMVWRCWACPIPCCRRWAPPVSWLSDLWGTTLGWGSSAAVLPRYSGVNQPFAAAMIALLSVAAAAVAAAAVVGESAAVAVSVGATPGQLGFVMAMAGGAVLSARSLWRRGHRRGHLPRKGPVGASLAFGALMAVTEEPWLTIALTASVAWLAIAGSHSERRQYLWAGAAAAVAATWAWLAFADVTVLEGYTLPATAVALTAGVAGRRRVALSAPGPPTAPPFSSA